MKSSFLSQLRYIFALFAFEVAVLILVLYFAFNSFFFLKSCNNENCFFAWGIAIASGFSLVFLLHGFVQTANKVMSLQYSILGKAPDLITLLQITLDKYGELIKIEIIGSLIQSIIFLIASSFWFSVIHIQKHLPLASAIIFGFSLAWIFWAHFFFLSLRRRASIVELMTNKPWYESFHLALQSLFVEPDSFSVRAIILSICTFIVWISLLCAVVIVPPFFFLALCMLFFLEFSFRTYHYWFQIPLVTRFLQAYDDEQA